jgi:GNAT superfamily N-acetyltransferase
MAASAAVSYSLREATPEDFDFARDVKLEGLRPYIEKLWGWDDDAEERHFRETFDLSAATIISSESGKVGFYELVDQGFELFLAGIYIDARFRGRGLGTAVLRDLVAEARARQLPLALRVLRPNPARRLYERLGFRATRATKTHVLMTCSAWVPRRARACN